VSQLFDAPVPQKGRAQTGAEIARRWRQNHPEQHKEGIYKWRKANPEKLQELQARASARRRGFAYAPTRSRPATCEICGQSGPLAYDHDHVTGTFRGWICHPCNLTLGLVKDNPETLRKIATYLEGD
jgi:hypothetical protein